MESSSSSEAASAVPDEGPQRGGREAAAQRRISVHSRVSSSHSIEATTELRHMDEIKLKLQALTPKVAQSVARMEVTNPEVLRVTLAHQAFDRCALALRVGTDADLYFKSERSEKISTFWSHSWHGQYQMKIITLVFLYNGAAAFLLGSLAALAAMLLHLFHVTPGFQRAADGRHQYSCWCLCSGFLVTSLVFIFWRPRTRVFLDRICISQSDHALKANAIFSLAGLLKRSDSMLILWDPTWTERLWCLFELAAFLKSKSDQKKELRIRPIFLGPVSIGVWFTAVAATIPLILAPVNGHAISFILPAALMVLCGLVVGYATVFVLRSYFRDLDIMRRQLQDISFDVTRSACCDNDHVEPSSGEPMMCDRQVVKECVNLWFGNQETFENLVRLEVLDLVVHDLSQSVFTTPWALGITAPLMWAFMDLAASQRWESDPAISALTASEAASSSIRFFLEGGTLWLVGVPCLKDLCILICRMTRARPGSTCMEILKNLATLLTVAALLVAIIACYVLGWVLPLRGPLERAAVFMGFMLFYATSSRVAAFALRKCFLGKAPAGGPASE